MIQFANKDTRHLIWSMWKTCFQDTDEYIDLIFSKKYKDENTLIYFEDDRAVASLQMWPYTIQFYGQPLPFYYHAGLCTLPEYRNKGYMGKLIKESFRVMQSRNISLSILVPAEDWLFGYYEKYGYVQTFEQGTQTFNLHSLVDDYHNNRGEAYLKFNSEFQKDDFYVLKSKVDLDAIIEEYIQDGQPDKFNLAAMSSIIEVVPVLELFAEKYRDKDFKIKVTGQYNQPDQIYWVFNGNVCISTSGDYDLSVDIKLLTRLLFGFKLDELSPEYSPFFEEHYPVINLMLE